MILIFPGFWTRPEDYQPLQKLLSEQGEESQVLDLFSPRSSCPAPRAWPEWRKEIRSWIRDLAEAPHLILGYSLGGRLLLDLELEQSLGCPLVFTSTHPGLRSAPERADRQASDENWARRFESENWDELQTAWNHQGVFSNSHALERKEADYDRKRLAAALRFFSLALQKDFGADLLRLPAANFHWVVGGQDKKFLAEAQRLQAGSPQFPLHVITHSGHRLPWDAPKDLLSLIQSSLCVA